MKKRILVFINLIAIPILLFIAFGFFSEGFGAHSISVILNQTMLPTAMGLGVSACLLAGMVDLSVGTKTIMGAVVGGLMSRELGIVGLIVGCFAGTMIASVVQAVLYRFLRIPAMILSVGIIMLYEVISALIGGAAAYIRIGSDIAVIGSFPYNLYIMLLCGAIFYILFYRTKTGSQINAVGDKEKLCKNLGINVDKIKFMSYVFSAIMCGFGSILAICYSETISVPIGTSTMTMVFKPIMGALIGMQLVKVYDNLPLLVFIGELSIQIIFNGLIALGLTDAWQNVVLGVFIILVMWVTGTEAPSLKKIHRLFRRNIINA